MEKLLLNPPRKGCNMENPRTRIVLSPRGKGYSIKRETLSRSRKVKRNPASASKTAGKFAQELKVSGIMGLGALAAYAGGSAAEQATMKMTHEKFLLEKAGDARVPATRVRSFLAAKGAIGIAGAIATAFLVRKVAPNITKDANLQRNLKNGATAGAGLKMVTEIMFIVKNKDKQPADFKLVSKPDATLQELAVGDYMTTQPAQRKSTSLTAPSMRDYMTTQPETRQANNGLLDWLETDALNDFDQLKEANIVADSDFSFLD